MDDASHSLGPGVEIADYRVQSLIARDSMGVVYQAHDIELDRPVALKLLAPEFSAHGEFSQRFIRDSRLAASVDHPNILPVYGAGEWSGLLYVVMRYVRGPDLKAELDRHGTLPLPEVRRILSDTAAALDAAHAAGLVHGDVGPGNILLSDDTPAEDSPSGGSVDGHHHVFLTGFGLGGWPTSATGACAAPEQRRGEGVDGRADVYALACVAYTLLAGHPPFDHEDDAARLPARPAEEPPRLSAERPDVPAAVEAAILRGMATDRGDRPSSCGALVAMMSDDAEAGDGPLRPRSAEAATEPEAPTADGARDTRTTAAQPPDGVPDDGPGPGRDRHGGSRHRAAARVDGRTRQLVLVGTVLLLLIAVGLVLTRLSPGERHVTFRADGVPYTLEVPESWTARTHQAGDSTVSVLSAADLTPLFADDPDAPAAVSELADDEPGSVVGLAIYHRPTGLQGQSPGALVDTAEALLPGREAYLVHRGETAVGDLGGQVMEGSMQLPAATLQVRVLAVEAGPDQLLVFFAPSSLFQERTEVFDEVAGSLRRIE